MSATRLTAAVRELRESLGLTQQEFAHRLNKAISTVIRYESTREPSGRALIELAVFAAANGRADLSVILVEALQRELGNDVFISLVSQELSLFFDIGHPRLEVLPRHMTQAWLLRHLYQLLLQVIADIPEGEKRDRIAKGLQELKPAIDFFSSEMPAEPSSSDANRNSPQR